MTLVSESALDASLALFQLSSVCEVLAVFNSSWSELPLVFEFVSIATGSGLEVVN
eukprot:CAMPEP_0172368750 /NCGR_PEP_ID=MMETSP1060-20121228/29150_1 /TAXON_ID=37318 /ORGANISM="Pseudo-nitzschia pungens, Strain cf. cingulata" /LENGTH=54 /DNA_ID=CAMNT_0013093449 /DNA_START=98 /DNA_END=259 /DNA_ORIENTATION=-